MASSTFVAPTPKQRKPRRPPPLIIPDRLPEANVSSLPSHCYDLCPLSTSSPSSSASSLSPSLIITHVEFPADFLPSAGATRRGTRRSRNEDRIFSGGENLWGICDGHGGTEVVDLASEYLSEHLPISDDPTRIFRALSLRTNEPSGTTITAAKIVGETHDTLQIVHLGDSKACLVGNNTRDIIQLTKDHIPSNAYEELCIRRNGGIIINGRVNGILGVTRALGNSQLHGIISITPDIINYRLRNSNNNLLILASDGFFDVIPKYTLLEILNDIPNTNSVPDDLQAAAETLITAAVNRQSTDDISVVLVDLRSISSNPPVT